MEFRYQTANRLTRMSTEACRHCTLRGEMVKAWNDVKKLPPDNAERKRTWKKFECEYWKKLSRIGADNILPLLSEGDVYLCWCGKRSECHRGILAAWLEKQGVEVEEL